MVARAIYRTALKSRSRGGNVSALVTWVGKVGFDEAVAKLKDQVDPKTGQPYGEERAKRIVGKLKGMANRRGQLRPEHAYDPKERAAAKAWTWRDILKAKGEGSRGGHVIGHTRSGKPIYDSHGHSAHRGFAVEDHNDAAIAHERVAESSPDRAKRLYHRQQSFAHQETAERGGRSPRRTYDPNHPIVSRVHQDGHLWDIGQLSDDERRVLAAAIRRGHVKKERAMWPWGHVGTAEKTRYLPGDTARDSGAGKSWSWRALFGGAR